jgi:hypothetical protein
MRAPIESVPREKIEELLKLLSLADLKQDPLSPLPLELALAESLAPPAAARTAAPAAPPQSRPAPSRPAPPTRAPAFSNRPAAAPPPRAEPERVPADLKKSTITGASAEDIARMVGSKTAVIPPAGDLPDEAVPAPNGNGASGGIDLSTFVETLRPRMKESDPKLGIKLAALVNGTCHAVSWQDGVLTLGFYADAYQKKTVETEHRKRFEDVASQILGAPVSIRCIIAPKPAAKLATKSALVQHAVENRGAKIIEQ